MRQERQNCSTLIQPLDEEESDKSKVMELVLHPDNTLSADDP